MQRGTWSFDDHTTSTWVSSDGIPGPDYQQSTQQPDESAGWDDPNEATRKLSPRDLARTVESATDLNMDWDEDESTTYTYNPALMAESLGLPTIPTDPDTYEPNLIQASPRRRMKTDPAMPPPDPRRQRMRSGMVPRAEQNGEPGTKPYGIVRARDDERAQLDPDELEEERWYAAHSQSLESPASREQREARQRAEREAAERARQEREWREARARAEWQAGEQAREREGAD